MSKAVRRPGYWKDYYQQKRRGQLDRLEFDVPRGGKYVLRAVAKKYGISGMEVMRRLLLGAAKLKEWPDAETMRTLAAVQNQQEAKDALHLARIWEIRRNEEQIRSKKGYG